MYIILFQIFIKFWSFEPFLSSVVRHMFRQCLLSTKLRKYRGRIILWTFEMTSFFVTWRHCFSLLEEEESSIQIS